MTIMEGLQNARELLEHLGYGPGGDIHDDLNLAICRLQSKYPATCTDEMERMGETDLPVGGYAT